ncbi:uncharacterized protein TM35_000771010 [Trypanosoma theileri]|uniref:Mucin-associated surface protein (MASP) n=1 Tax=Trypanosoma theileri TaxID=67003 RepID=A0A1X0NFB5_9TRYP|nr:uncharacterized protein TM35_000771010 [Trypanosoma theileri]ORC83139.1 hypothetical protein TM35_000771010 [Trypanosoma theileri]
MAVMMMMMMMMMRRVSCILVLLFCFSCSLVLAGDPDSEESVDLPPVGDAKGVGQPGDPLEKTQAELQRPDLQETTGDPKHRDDKEETEDKGDSPEIEQVAEPAITLGGKGQQNHPSKDQAPHLGGDNLHSSQLLSSNSVLTGENNRLDASALSSSSSSTVSLGGVELENAKKEEKVESPPHKETKPNSESTDNDSVHEPPVHQTNTVNSDSTHISQNTVQEQSPETSQSSQVQNGTNDAERSNTEPHETPVKQPSSTSPTTSATENTNDTNTSANTNNDTPNTISNEESTTTTTTTTTTLSPELTNNKKGDADSSSSIISSSVWVRVPLLIMVTLACILVC